jgi:6-phosphofructokinase 1
MFFQPEEVKAAIVTCGGLCPGINVVVRELVMTLYRNYKVKEVWGVKGGFNGIYQNEWVELTPEKVEVVHHKGGTFLGTSRYTFDEHKIVEELRKKGINQLYVLGGEGTMRCLLSLYHQVTKRNLKLAICGIPKSIENDVPIIDKSFGVETAIEES